MCNVCQVGYGYIDMLAIATPCPDDSFRYQHPELLSLQDLLSVVKKVRATVLEPLPAYKEVIGSEKQMLIRQIRFLMVDSPR